MPQGYKFKFNKSLYRKLKRFIANTSNKIMFIYGEYDPWSAVMVNEPKNENVVPYIDPKGSHRARISTLPEEIKAEAILKLGNWINE